MDIVLYFLLSLCRVIIYNLFNYIIYLSRMHKLSGDTPPVCSYLHVKSLELGFKSKVAHSKM